MSNPVLPYKGRPLYLIDSDEESRNASKQALTDAGYEVRAFGNPNRAIDAVGSRIEKFDTAIIVVDITLDGFSGYEFVRRIAKVCMSKKIPIIMTAKYETAEDKSEASQVGANGLISRPITIPNFYQALEDYRLRLLKAEIGELVFDVGYD
jgi:CheY-like chemotaxis protein